MPPILESHSLKSALRIAKRLLLESKYLEAMQIYSEIILKYPGNSEAKTQLRRLSRDHTKTSNSVEEDNPPQEVIQRLLTNYERSEFSLISEELSVLERQFPKSSFLWKLKGGIALKHDNLKNAKECFKKALLFKKVDTNAYLNLGIIARREGNLTEAAAILRKAIEMNPRSSEAYSNLGNILIELQDTCNAVRMFEKAIDLEPNNEVLYYNLGVAYFHASDFEKSLSSLSKSVAIKSSFVPALNKLGECYFSLGRNEKALSFFQESLQHDPHYTVSKFNMGLTLANYTFMNYDATACSTLASLLYENLYICPERIIGSVISLLYLDPILGPILTEKVSIESLDCLNNALRDLGQSSLLCAALENCVLANLELEKFFTHLRKCILLNFSKIESDKHIERLLECLSIQNILNEYVMSVTEQEIEELDLLYKFIAQRSPTSADSLPRYILIYSLYRHLHTLPTAWHGTVSNFRNFYHRAFVEHQETDQLVNTIASFSDSITATSQEVKDHYEENPYPRWRGIGAPAFSLSPSDVLRSINLKVPDIILQGDSVPNILIAGCGTGRTAIESAFRFKNSKILAFDLSYQSLAYAKFHANRLGVENISFIHGDILNLQSLGKTFDIIECTGVLHHMKSPTDGLQKLTMACKSNGIIKIALYSKTARQSILRIRKMAFDKGVETDADSLRALRRSIVQSTDFESLQVTKFIDFYSLSEFRDMAMHRHEINFDIPQIKILLEDCDLQFAGFELSKSARLLAKSINPKGNLTQLDPWQTIEASYPSFFSAMYQFWCFKANQ